MSVQCGQICPVLKVLLGNSRLFQRVSRTENVKFTLLPDALLVLTTEILTDSRISWLQNAPIYKTN